MALLLKITASPETLSDMLIAADDRYQDAEELLAQQRFDGCVYMLGFSTYMWLKAACLRLRGLKTNDRRLVGINGFKKIHETIRAARSRAW